MCLCNSLSYSPYYVNAGCDECQPWISYNKFKELCASQEAGREAARLSDSLPAVNEEVIHPVNAELYYLSGAIASLNDEYKWTREQIADWLDTLDLDLRFDV